MTRLTEHARIRKQQRGFSDLSLDIIQQYGRCEKAPGGATRFFFGRKEYQDAVGDLRYMIQGSDRKKVIRLMDRAKGGKIIIKEGYIITAYK